MAIGRISGPMLFSNLERQGVDLAFQSNLLYIDVNNLRVGIINTSPQYAFDSSGNVKLANIIVLGNTITSNTGRVNLGSTSNIVITGGQANSVMYTDGLGNLNWGNISEISPSFGNVTITSGNIVNLITNNFISGNALITGGNVTLSNAYVITGNTENFSTGNAVISGGYLYGISNITATTGNVESWYTTSTNSTSGNIINLYTQNVSTGNAVISGGYISGLTNAYITTSQITNFSTGNAVINGGYISSLSNITATTGNVNSWYVGQLNSTAANITGLTSTNFSSGNVLISGGYISALANANIGNLNFADTTISSLTGNVTIQPLLSNPNAVVIIAGTSALQLPSGTTGEQPTVAATGSIRWNSTNSRVEYYTGTAWAAITGQIDNQVITPDGSSVAYTLDYTSTAEGIIVSINGTLQQPDVAYTVSGTTITFNEIPLTTDIISIRFIASGVSGFAGGEVTGNVYISDTTTSTSTTTGALVVNGGTGIVGNIHVGGNATIGSLAGIGSRTVTASATGLLSAASDSSLKTEISNIPIPGLAEILQIQPKAYKWNSDIALRGNDAAIEIGFFADQVAPIIPSAAPKGHDNLYGFYDRSVLAALVKAVQEQQVTITELQQKIANLQANQK
jgi:hypothetical protein